MPPGSAGLQVGSEAAPGLMRCDVALSLLWPRWFPECHLPLVIIPHPWWGGPWEKRSSLPSLWGSVVPVPQSQPLSLSSGGTVSWSPFPEGRLAGCSLRVALAQLVISDASNLRTCLNRRVGCKHNL